MTFQDAYELVAAYRAWPRSGIGIKVAQIRRERRKELLDKVEALIGQMDDTGLLAVANLLASKGVRSPPPVTVTQ